MKLHAFVLSCALAAASAAAQQPTQPANQPPEPQAQQDHNGSAGGSQLSGEAPKSNPSPAGLNPNDAQVERGTGTQTSANDADEARGDISGLWGLLGLLGLLGLGRRTRDKFADRDRDHDAQVNRDARGDNLRRMDDRNRRLG